MPYKPDPSVTSPDLTIPQAMAYLQLSARYIFRLIHDGVIESYKIGETRRIRKTALDRFRQEQMARGPQFIPITGKRPIGRPKKPQAAE